MSSPKLFLAQSPHATLPESLATFTPTKTLENIMTADAYTSSYLFFGTIIPYPVVVTVTIVQYIEFKYRS